MPFDHSSTYKRFSLKNVFHISRFNYIINKIKSFNNITNYCDIGCSNGYITFFIANKLGISNSFGYDHNRDNLNIARNKYPNIKFDYIDLNLPNPSLTIKKYHLVTCFETLEHVGNLHNALETLVALLEKNGILFISVPNEVGIISIIKFIAKTILFKYNLKELGDIRYFDYLYALVSIKDISSFRPVKKGYGTHFGFNYKKVEQFFNNKNISYKRFKKGTSVFYIVYNNY